MIVALAKGLALTFKTLFRPRITLQYPDEKKVMYERWRERPCLVGRDGQEHVSAVVSAPGDGPAQGSSLR